jgi:hypothetical protein
MASDFFLRFWIHVLAWRTTDSNWRCTNATGRLRSVRGGFISTVPVNPAPFLLDEEEGHPSMSRINGHHVVTRQLQAGTCYWIAVVLAWAVPVESEAELDRIGCIIWKYRPRSFPTL